MCNRLQLDAQKLRKWLPPPISGCPHSEGRSTDRRHETVTDCTLQWMTLQDYSITCVKSRALAATHHAVCGQSQLETVAAPTPSPLAAHKNEGMWKNTIAIEVFVIKTYYSCFFSVKSVELAPTNCFAQMHQHKKCRHTAADARTVARAIRTIQHWNFQDPHNFSFLVQSMGQILFSRTKNQCQSETRV